MTDKKQKESDHPVIVIPLEEQDHKIARKLLKASEFGREPKWAKFLEYCERIGVDCKEMCQWTHDLLDLEYNQSFKDRKEILKIRDHIVASWNKTQKLLSSALTEGAPPTSDGNDGGKP